MVIKKTKDGYECDCGGKIEVRRTVKTLQGYYINGKCMKCDGFKIFKVKFKPPNR